MSDSNAVAAMWLAKKQRSAALTAAKRVGLTLAEYQQRVTAGTKYCTGCRAWHPVDKFGRDSSRSDGRSASCKNARAQRYEPTVRAVQPSGRRFVAARDGDKRQARRRVNHLVDQGLLPRPYAVPCVDCGDLNSALRHEYDHHLGYAAEHHESVEAVCSKCHHQREAERAGRTHDATPEVRT